MAIAFILGNTGARNDGFAHRALDTLTSIVNLVAGAGLTLGVAVALVLAIASRVSSDGTPSLAGHEAIIVRSGSMAPAFSAGDAVIIEHIDQSQVTDLGIGDVITFRPDSTNAQLVTHRIANVVTGPGGFLAFVTKGDANPQVDPTLVPGRHVVGITRLTVPRLGYVLHGVGQQHLLLMFGAALVLGRLAVALMRFADDQEDNNQPTGGNQ